MSGELESVLYVDDEADMRAVARIALETVGGLRVALCDGAEQALAEAPAFAPDLLLLDVVMPGRDGPATLAALRQLPGLAETPVIFLTGGSDAGELAALRGPGVIDVVAKPFDPMTLADTLRTLWNGYS